MNFQAKLSNLALNISNNSFLSWNNPREEISSWFFYQEDRKFWQGNSGPAVPRTYCRLVIDREKLMMASHCVNSRSGYKALDSALRGGGVIWRSRFTPFSKLPKEVKETLRALWHEQYRVVVG